MNFLEAITVIKNGEKVEPDNGNNQDSSWYMCVENDEIVCKFKGDNKRCANQNLHNELKYKIYNNEKKKNFCYHYLMIYIRPLVIIFLK